MCRRFGWSFVAERAGFELSQDCGAERFNRSALLTPEKRVGHGESWLSERTFQPVDCPLLELLERNLCRGRDFVEGEAVGVFLLLVSRICELLLLVADGVFALWINPIWVLT